VTRPTIIVVSHLCPFPTVHGNRRRFVSLLEWLKGRGFSITYVLQPIDVDDEEGIAKLRQLVDRLEIVSGPYGRVAGSLIRYCSRVANQLLPGRVAACLRNLVARGRQFGARMQRTGAREDIVGDRHIDTWCWPTTCHAVHRVVKRDHPLAVITEYALLSKCLELVPRPILRVIDTVEVFLRNPERFHVDGLSAPFICSPESEQHALNRADLLLAIQKNDTQILTALFPRKHIITVPHTYAHGQPRMASGLRVGAVLYVGSSNPFNVHGLQQFLKEAWQPILKRLPGATLRVVGSIPLPPDADVLRVVCVGRVTDEELAHEYQTAHVVINPQVAGTGLKIKCVEALSAGCPLVVHEAGADGLEEGAGTAFLIASDWPNFAKQVVAVMTDDPLRLALEAEARRFAATMFSAEVTFSEIAKVFSTLDV
jgi:glycosyltransferase involved in cell wall biosynthesis